MTGGPLPAITSSSQPMMAARRFFGRLVERDCAEHVAVVGHGDGVHACRGDALDQVFDLKRAVEQRVLGVDVKVDEIGSHDGDRFGKLDSDLPQVSAIGSGRKARGISRPSSRHGHAPPRTCRLWRPPLGPRTACRFRTVRRVYWTHAKRFSAAWPRSLGRVLLVDATRPPELGGCRAGYRGRAWVRDSRLGGGRRAKPRRVDRQRDGGRRSDRVRRFRMRSGQFAAHHLQSDVRALQRLAVLFRGPVVLPGLDRRRSCSACRRARNRPTLARA